MQTNKILYNSMCRLWLKNGITVVCPVTESREYGNPIPSQNASLSNNYNITSAVHNCMCAFNLRADVTRALYAPQICWHYYVNCAKPRIFEEILLRFLVYRTRGKILLMRTKSDPRIYATKNSRTVWKRGRAI